MYGVEVAIDRSVADRLSAALAIAVADPEVALPAERAVELGGQGTVRRRAQSAHGGEARRAADAASGERHPPTREGHPKKPAAFFAKEL